MKRSVMIILILFLTFTWACALFKNKGGPERPQTIFDNPSNPAPQPTATVTANGNLRLDNPPEEMTFISTDNINCSATILNNDPPKNYLVRWTIIAWEVISETGDEYTLQSTGEADRVLDGQQRVFLPSPPAAPIRRDYKLYYEINVELLENGSSINQIQSYIVQDTIDQCRQEYVDFRRATVPTHENFKDSVGTSNFSLEKLSNNSRYGTDAVFIQTNLTNGLETLRKSLGNKDLYINWGYRCPYDQYRLSDAPEGNHQYGIAADIWINQDFNNDNKISSDDWIFVKNKAKAANACVEPADYNNPKDPNYTYIHVDWRGTCPTNW